MWVQKVPRRGLSSLLLSPRRPLDFVAQKLQSQRSQLPWPSNPCVFWKITRENPKKTRAFLFAEPLKLWNYRQCHYLRLPSPKLQSPNYIELPSVAQGRKGSAVRKGPALRQWLQWWQSEGPRSKATTGDSGDYNDRSCYYGCMSSYVWLPSWALGGGRETDYYGHEYRREGAKRRAPLRPDDQEDGHDHCNAGSTTGEVRKKENHDIVRLRHRTDWPTTQMRNKNHLLFFTW